MHVRRKNTIRASRLAPKMPPSPDHRLPRKCETNEGQPLQRGRATTDLESENLNEEK